MSDNLTGRCNCGAVRFELTEPLLGASYCHCKRCQRRTGSGGLGQRPGSAGFPADPLGRGPDARLEA